MKKLLSVVLISAATHPLVSMPAIVLGSAISITTIAAPAQATYIEGIYINMGGSSPYFYGSYSNTGAPVFADSTWEIMGENNRILAHGSGATPRWIWGLVQRFFGG
jgi:hypothetical protein